MKKETKKIVEDLIKKGIIESITDLTGEEGIIKNKKDLTSDDYIIQSKEALDAEAVMVAKEPGPIFDYMIQHYAYLLDPNPEIALPEKEFEHGNVIHELISKFGKYTLRTPQKIENGSSLMDENKENEEEKTSDEPTIYVSNHRFKDDVLASILPLKKRTFMVIGSLPEFFCTVSGLVAAKNGVVLVNRKSEVSKSTIVEKAKRVLEHGTDLYICPEGGWNKTPNAPMLEFWSGFYRIAQKEDGSFRPIVPIVHYVYNTFKRGLTNPIHTVVDNPIKFDSISTDATKEEKREKQKDEIEKVRTRMVSLYWRLLEKYGKTTREELLEGYNDSTEAWEDELTKRIATVKKYDIEAETTADRNGPDERIEIWKQITEWDESKDKEGHIKEARFVVEELEKNDFQHKF